MPFTAQEEEDLKKRILQLEEAKTAAEKSAAGSPKREELDAVKAELTETRKELSALRAAKGGRGPGAEDPDRDESFPFDMREPEEGK